VVVVLGSCRSRVDIGPLHAFQPIVAKSLILHCMICMINGCSFGVSWPALPLLLLLLSRITLWKNYSPRHTCGSSGGTSHQVLRRLKLLLRTGVPHAQVMNTMMKRPRSTSLGRVQASALEMAHRSRTGSQTRSLRLGFTGGCTSRSSWGRVSSIGGGRCGDSWLAELGACVVCLTCTICTGSTVRVIGRSCHSLASRRLARDGRLSFHGV
jgi:hypothetical protein